MAELPTQPNVIQSANLIDFKGNGSRLQITSEWLVYLDGEKLHHPTHAGFVLASMIQVADVPLPVSGFDRHISNVSSIAKMKYPEAATCPLIENGQIDPIKKISAIRSLEHGITNPRRHHLYRIGQCSSKSAFLLFCTDNSNEDFGATRIEKYHEIAESPESRKESDISIFRREYKRRQKVSLRSRN